MSEEEKSKLKREISKRWPLISRDADSKEFAQLEYILQEAGLLARPRRRLAKIENLEAAITAKSA
jgi:hypothetical protein